MDKIIDQIKYFIKKEKTVMDKVVIIYTILAILIDIFAFCLGEGYMVTVLLVAILQLLQVIRFKKQDKKEVASYKMSTVVAFIWFFVIVFKKIV
ncbi:MAG: hypothetical protein PUC65_08425 [Clostridiales bacterium]|nr:hypothetical protein [Clostridiales bacterium]